MMQRWIAAMAMAGCAMMAAAQDKDIVHANAARLGIRPNGSLGSSPVPPEQIIKEFSAKETQFQEALESLYVPAHRAASTRSTTTTR
jgi:hypothetical protein